MKVASDEAWCELSTSGALVYNHLAEGNAAGPTICFCGLANEVDYILSRTARNTPITADREYAKRQ